MTAPAPPQSVTAVADYMYRLLLDHHEELGLAPRGVWYGDQRLVPAVPAVTVMPGRMTRQIVGAPFRTEENIPIKLTVFHMMATHNPSEAPERHTTVIAERISDLLHRNSKMGGLVIQGFVTALVPGYTVNQGRLMNACQLTWEGLTRTCLPMQFTI